MVITQMTEYAESYLQRIEDPDGLANVAVDVSKVSDPITPRVIGYGTGCCVEGDS